MKYTITCIIMISTLLTGQFRPEEREPNPGMVIKWKLTEFLDITEEQAETFFPRVNTLENDLKSLREKDKELFKELNEMIDEEKVSSKKVDKILDELYTNEEKRLQLKRDHIKNMDDILSPEQMAKYVAFERSFKHRLKDRFREKKHKRGGFRKKLHRDWD